MNKIFLKPQRDESLLRFHPWIFSGAIKQIEGNPAEGDLVEVYSSQGQFRAIGHYQPQGSISVRVVTFTQEVVDKEFWKKKLEKAYLLRKSIGLAGNPDNNVYRLVHGEGDAMPGLVIDIYHHAAVFQAHSVGMYRLKDMFAAILAEIYDGMITAVYDKSEGTLFAHAAPNGYLYGSMPDDHQFVENGLRFQADWESGQKTGFFIDQRENRQLVERYAADRNVLNLFGYTGAFSVYALRGGAKMVHTVDSSQKAIDRAIANVELNFPSDDKHQAFVSDCFDFLKDMKPGYDLMIVDPPAFAKNRHSLKNALQAYKRLNTKALELIRPGGIYFTFSCSQVVSSEQFRSAIFSAAVITGRQIRIIHQLTQPADHPVNIFHPESEYLKGLVLFVE